MTDSAYSKISGNICEAFKVSPANCDQYLKLYNDKLLPRIWKKYLAHLVASVAEVIDEKMEKDGTKESWEGSSEGNVRKFSITLSSGNPLGNANAESHCYRNGVDIIYKPIDNRKDLRIFIAHELGHVLTHYGVIIGNEIENYANTFAFFAISGKNDFYKSDVEELKYDDDIQIIDSIQRLCPVKEIRQENETRLKKEY